MKIIVKKAGDAEKKEMASKPVWGCGVFILGTVLT